MVPELPWRSVLILRGLPGSGKTTLARQLVAERGFKRVNKDDLRAMIDNGEYSSAKERLIEALRDRIIVIALRDGCSVVVDDTNIEGDHIEHIRSVVDEYCGRSVEVAVYDLDTPIDECIRRDAARPAPVGEGVIRRMASAKQDRGLAPLTELNQ